jgi:hypothetical protein
LLLGLARAVTLGSKSGHILLSFETPPTWRAPKFHKELIIIKFGVVTDFNVVHIDTQTTRKETLTSLLEVEIAIAKLKKYKSPGSWFK